MVGRPVPGWGGRLGPNSNLWERPDTLSVSIPSTNLQDRPKSGLLAPLQCMRTLPPRSTRFHGNQSCSVSSGSDTVCVCASPWAELRRHAAEADRWYLQRARTHMLRGGPEGARGQQRGPQRGAESPAQVQRRSRGAGRGPLFLIALLILADGWQLLQQRAVAVRVHLRTQQDTCCHYDLPAGGSGTQQMKSTVIIPPDHALQMCYSSFVLHLSVMHLRQAQLCCLLHRSSLFSESQ